MAKSLKVDNDLKAWLEEQREAANIVINPIPANVPYNVDMSKYSTDASNVQVVEADDEEGSSGEAVEVEVEEENSSEASASAESSSASSEAASSSAASASAASSSASSEAASSEASKSAA